MRNRPYIWQMVKEAIEALGGEAARSEIIEYVTTRYPGAKESSVSTHISTCTVNAPSRIHDLRNRRPRIADSRYDFLFRTDEGTLVLYDSTIHGLWEIRRCADGDVVVALVGGRESPPRRRKKAADAYAPRQSWTMPTREAFLRGVEEYEKRERREAVYRLAELVVSDFWSDERRVAAAVAALLVSWNRPFYRMGMFAVAELERCIAENQDGLTHFRRRGISSLSLADTAGIIQLFAPFLDALRIASGTNIGRRSPVAVAKALHLLAPAFFPPWDNKIAKEYGCQYGHLPADQYVGFCDITRRIGEVARDYTTRSDKTLVKLIDQYNYAKFTRGWI